MHSLLIYVILVLNKNFKNLIGISALNLNNGMSDAWVATKNSSHTHEFELIPPASSLIQSMRDIGYTLNTAVADIIDNSITANATMIDIVYTNNNGIPSLMIIDNGQGMSKDELLDALRFAYISSTAQRHEKDLGRFGLGLKMATFSQARKLTVITSKDTVITCAQWDLDYIIKSQKWLLQVVDLGDIAVEECILEKIESNGTIVLWENIDRFGDNNDTKQLDSYMSELRDHIGLVFHRYLDKSNSKPLTINLNNVPILAFDPYLSNNPYTSHHPIEKIKIGDSIVSIQTHILPHHKRLKKEEEDFLQRKSDLLNNQGFYVYRNNRLMVWGDWFKLLKKSESTKQARIEINFDNTLDAEWHIDIKKSKVTPPPVVKNRLVEIINTIADSSKRVYGARVNKSLLAKDYSWQRNLVDGKIIYSINPDFSLLKNFKEVLDENQRKQFDVLMDIISNTLPIEGIYADISASPTYITNQQQKSQNDDSLLEKFYQILELMGNTKDTDKISSICQQTNLFTGNEKKLTKWIEDYVK